MSRFSYVEIDWEKARKKKKLRTIIAWVFVVLTIALYVTVSVIAISEYDRTQVYDAAKEDIAIEDIEDEGYVIKCKMDGCNAVATNRVSFEFSGFKESVSNINIENKANFTILSNTSNNYKAHEFQHSEDYYLLTPQGNGNYVITEEEYKYTEKTREKVGNIYRTGIEGTFCNKHATQARDMLEHEVVTALREDPKFDIAIGMFPYNFVLLLLFMLVPALMVYLNTRDKLKNAEQHDKNNEKVLDQSDSRTLFLAIDRCKSDAIWATIFAVAGVGTIIYGFSVQTRITQAVLVMGGCGFSCFFIMLMDRIMKIKAFKRWLVLFA